MVKAEREQMRRRKEDSYGKRKTEALYAGAQGQNLPRKEVATRLERNG